MRKGIVAIVPLFFGIVILFGFIFFMGGASDTLKSVSNVEQLSHLQTKLLLPALKKRYEEERDKGLPAPQAAANARAYVKKMMYKNNIDTNEE